MGTADADDNGGNNIGDFFRLLNFLFLGADAPPDPGPDVPGPDPTPDSCEAYDPAPPADLAALALGFECPAGLTPGARAVIFATLTTTANSRPTGVEGWSIGMKAENLKILAITTAETAGDLLGNGPGLRAANAFADSQVVAEGGGAVSAVLLSFLQPSSLPREGTVRIAALTVEAEPVAPGTMATGRMVYASDQRGGGQPVQNVVVLDGTAQTPAAGICELRINDCNTNGVADDQDLSAGTSRDCNQDAIPDECEADCNRNGTADACDLAAGTSADCNQNDLPDECDIEAGTAQDCDGDGVPAECRLLEDCNRNGSADSLDIAAGRSIDEDADGYPDECATPPGYTFQVLPDRETLCEGSELKAVPGARLAFNRYEKTGSAATARITVPEATAIVPVVLEVVLTSNSPGDGGVLQWSLAIATDASFHLVSATTAGTAGDARSADFLHLAMADPALNQGQQEGVVSRVRRFPRSPALDPVGEAVVLKLSGSIDTSGLAPGQETSPCHVSVSRSLCWRNCDQGGRVSTSISAGGRSPDWAHCDLSLIVSVASKTAFVRGDCNDDDRIDIADAVCALEWLFLGHPAPSCTATVNTNGDGVVDISDPVSLLGFLFLGRPPPVTPFPACGPTTLPGDAALGCETVPERCRE
jgi:hypothetical protein